MVAHAADVEAHQIEALHRRLIVEDARKERRPTNEVAGRHRHALLRQRFRAQPGQRRRQIGGAADHVLVRVLVLGQLRTAVGLEVSVVVVEGQQLQVKLIDPLRQGCVEQYCVGVADGPRPAEQRGALRRQAIQCLDCAGRCGVLRQQQRRAFVCCERGSGECVGIVLAGGEVRLVQVLLVGRADGGRRVVSVGTEDSRRGRHDVADCRHCGVTDGLRTTEDHDRLWGQIGERLGGRTAQFSPVGEQDRGAFATGHGTAHQSVRKGLTRGDVDHRQPLGEQRSQLGRRFVTVITCIPRHGSEVCELILQVRTNARLAADDSDLGGVEFAERIDRGLRQLGRLRE